MAGDQVLEVHLSGLELSLHREPGGQRLLVGGEDRSVDCLDVLLVPADGDGRGDPGQEAVADEVAGGAGLGDFLLREAHLQVGGAGEPQGRGEVDGGGRGGRLGGRGGRQQQREAAGETGGEAGGGAHLTSTAVTA